VKQADLTGVHAWSCQLLAYRASAALSRGDVPPATDAMAEMAARLDPARRFDVGYYHFLMAWRALIEGDVAVAAAAADTFIAEWQSLGMPFGEALAGIIAAQVRHAQGRADAAVAELRRSREAGRAMNNSLLAWAVTLVEAEIALDRGDREDARAAVSRALATGREHDLVNVWGWRPSAVARLCAAALERGIEMDHARRILRTRDLVLDPLQSFGLSRREAEVLRWLTEGKRDGEIAVILGISARTVQHHLQRIYAKLNVETRTAAVAVALQAPSGKS
jgi:DNA-binding CsgD family transcriptional regulator